MSSTTKRAARRAAAPAKDVSITALYAEFERADATCKAIPSEKEKEWVRALEIACKLAEKIASLPAANLGEMLLKIRIAAWDCGVPHANLEDLDLWQPSGDSCRNGLEYEVLASLRADLDRLRVSTGAQ
jgi:hypothetical protein